MLMLHSQRRTGLLITTKNRLLLPFSGVLSQNSTRNWNQRTAWIAATGLSTLAPADLPLPTPLLHQLIILAIGIGSAVSSKPSKLIRRLFAFYCAAA